jgi:hypothetical protein
LSSFCQIFPKVTTRLNTNSRSPAISTGRLS